MPHKRWKVDVSRVDGSAQPGFATDLSLICIIITLTFIIIHIILIVLITNVVLIYLIVTIKIYFNIIILSLP